MEKTKKIIKINVLIVLLLIITIMTMFGRPNTVKAETSTADNDNITTRGIYTKLSLEFNSNNGIVSATVKNEFTLGYSTIQVIVEIYSSYELVTSTDDMTLESRNTTTDLDIYKTITTSCSVGGEQKYWCAVMEYKQDSQDWVRKTTSMVLLDKNGNKVS